MIMINARSFILFRYPYDLVEYRLCNAHAFLEQVAHLLERKNKRVYIIKPDGGAMGHGLQLVTRLTDIKTHILKGCGRYIVQKYIPNPCLLNKRKFDFRIYALLTSVLGRPQAFVSKLGMVRFCTEEYCVPTRKNINNPFMHLTNYSINKDNHEKYIRSKDVHDKTNTKRLLEDVFEDLETKGLDILLDARGKAWLLEVNANPSLRIDYFDSKIGGRSSKNLKHSDEDR
ncbi:Tubulin-tyrosine ligase family protein [Cardiosporidium cionae]|uniref:Tubulin-tyrosine ligase family protein n=1 Tax=Cardiosporidium cionae TaxID=476202 RepID=A0ABQ7JAT2_9APIC|nr:Tubulin-tyrosine ligase family protein [Cardiosporidium cionae]|eukprot:KAF8820765.1 Tubulin-tyrosine ligase family protein [Cardiosporidium cionae]